MRRRRHGRMGGQQQGEAASAGERGGGEAVAATTPSRLPLLPKQRRRRPPSSGATRASFAMAVAPGLSSGEAFRLSADAGAGALKLHKGDITLWSVDGATVAIVNAANERMLGGGGVDGETRGWQILLRRRASQGVLRCLSFFFVVVVSTDAYAAADAAAARAAETGGGGGVGESASPDDGLSGEGEAGGREAAATAYSPPPRSPADAASPCRRPPILPCLRRRIAGDLLGSSPPSTVLPSPERSEREKEREERKGEGGRGQPAEVAS
uniref:Macro domain-containing protein n=1 Tax=Oryza sativa subsp. japonica TaxID=39947 RepID=Q6ZKH7_ORYSJ|nr:hypothetical protein [Oryza sativa Japonica Group]